MLGPESLRPMFHVLASHLFDDRLPPQRLQTDAPPFTPFPGRAHCSQANEA
jgi:hypothetical protein